MHGANAGPPLGNLNGLVHGAYVKRVLSEEELAIHGAFLAKIREDFELNNSSDEVAVLMAAMAFVQYSRAVEAGNADAAERFDRMVRSNLKDLKATKLAREGETSNSLNTSPAEWATALLEQIREPEKPKAKGKKASRGKTPNKRRI